MKTLLRFVIGLLFVASTLSTAWAQPRTAIVQLDSVWGCPGQEIEVPLRVFGVSELGVDNFQFTIRFNTDVLEPVLENINPEGTQGFPVITGFNDELQRRGSFVANFMETQGIMIAWIDRMQGQPSAMLEDGSVMFNINLRIRGQLAQPEPINIHIVTLYHVVWPVGVPYVVERRDGHVLAKSAPDVRIDRTFFDNPRYSQLEWPLGNPSRWSDITLCLDEPFQFKATGAERFEWRSVLRPGAGSNTLPEALSHLVLDRTDVYNPVFTGRNREWFRNAGFTWLAPAPIRRYDLEVKGFNSDGCFGIDTVRIFVDQAIRHPLVDQPTHIIIERGETIDLALELEPSVDGIENTFAHDHYWAPQIIRWFPHDLIQDPKQVVERFTDHSNPRLPRAVTTQTGPIYESTWIWAEIRQMPTHIADTIFYRAINTRQGCVQFLNIRVDIQGEMFNARISAKNPENLQEYDYFCGTPGVTEHSATLAVLVEGGVGERTYTWDFITFEGGQEPHFTDASANPTEITFFGTTQVAVTIIDEETEQEITVYHTLTVETAKTLTVNVAMDEASQRFFEMGFCQIPEMPLTLIATVDNQGANYQVFWEETRPMATPDGTVYRTFRIEGMQGHVANFPMARAGSVYRAVVESSDRCVAQHTVWSNDVDPESQWFEHYSVILDNVGSPGCNSDQTLLRFRTFNSGTDPLFHIYRNDDLYEEFEYHFPNPSRYHTGFTRQVQSLNYWDRFSIRFTNRSARCMRRPYAMSAEITPNVQTTQNVNAGNIVSIFGGDNEVCNTTDGVFTFHLQNMTQFGRETTVIWKINGEEWGRYEFEPSLADALPAAPQRPDNPRILNDLLRVNDTTPFSEAMAFRHGYALHLNAEGFPQIGTHFVQGDKLSVFVISRIMCGQNAGQIRFSETELIPQFIDVKEAVLAVTPDNLNVCRGDRIEFTASLEHINMSAGLMSWYLNDRRVGEGATFALNNALNNDEVVVRFESNFACVRNLPLQQTRVVTAHDLPTLALFADSIVCYGETLQLLAETNAETILWTGNYLSNPTAKNPTATPPGLMFHHFQATATNEKGCQTSASITVRTAPKTEITANIWLEDENDTVICRNQVVVFLSDFSPSNTGTPFERVWLRNGTLTPHTSAELATSAIRDGDVWQLQIAMPTLNTCLPRKITSNPMKMQVNPLVEVDVALALSPEFHTNNCENSEGAYLFLATSGVSDAGRIPRFDWYINNTNVAFQRVNAVEGIAPQTLWGRSLQPGDEVHVVMTTVVGNCRRLIATSDRIQILQGPQVPDVVGTTVICPGETTVLMVQNPQSDVTFRWYSSADNFTQAIRYGDTLNDIVIGQYRLVAVSDENNCERSVDVQVRAGLQPRARIALLTPPPYVRAREPVRFRNEGVGWLTAYWQFCEESDWVEHVGRVVEHTFDTIDNYLVTLQVVSLDGCVETYSLSLDVLPGMVGVFVPTAFMPGCSHCHLNDRYLKVFATDQNPIVSLRFTVFAMDGRELFTTNDPNRGWDGRYNGRDMPTGNYSWMVSARLDSGEEVMRSGVSTLVR